MVSFKLITSYIADREYRVSATTLRFRTWGLDPVFLVRSTYIFNLSTCQGPKLLSSHRPSIPSAKAPLPSWYHISNSQRTGLFLLQFHVPSVSYHAAHRNSISWTWPCTLNTDHSPPTLGSSHSLF